MWVLHSSLLLDNILFHEYITFVLSHSIADDIWIVSTLWVLWIMLLWSLMYEFIYGHILSFLLAIPKSEIAGSYSNSMLNILRHCQKLFSRMASPFYVLPTVNEDCNFSISSCYFLSFLMITILLELIWYLIVVLIYASLMTNDLEHLFLCFIGRLLEKFIQLLCQSLIQLVVFTLGLLSVYIFWRQILSNVWFEIVAFCRLSFNFLVLSTNVLNLNLVQIIYFPLFFVIWVS